MTKSSAKMKMKNLKMAIQYLEESGSITIHALEDWQLEEAIASFRQTQAIRSRQAAKPEDRCMARVWKGECGTEGVGSQCNRVSRDGCFCKQHAKLGTGRTRHTAVPNKSTPYAWEHHGRWDERPPQHFKNLECWHETPSPPTLSTSPPTLSPTSPTKTPPLDPNKRPTEMELFGSDFENESDDEETHANFEIKIDMEGISWKVKTDGSNEAYELCDDDLDEVAGTWNEKEKMVD